MEEEIREELERALTSFRGKPNTSAVREAMQLTVMRVLENFDYGDDLLPNEQHDLGWSVANDILDNWPFPIVKKTIQLSLNSWKDLTYTGTYCINVISSRLRLDVQYYRDRYETPQGYTVPPLSAWAGMVVGGNACVELEGARILSNYEEVLSGSLRMLTYLIDTRGLRQLWLDGIEGLRVRQTIVDAYGQAEAENPVIIPPGGTYLFYPPTGEPLNTVLVCYRPDGGGTPVWSYQIGTRQGTLTKLPRAAFTNNLREGNVGRYEVTTVPGQQHMIINRGNVPLVMTCETFRLEGLAGVITPEAPPQQPPPRREEEYRPVAAPFVPIQGNRRSIAL